MKEQIIAVQRMQDYIETHYAEEITLADLARAARFSPWYARRMFLEWTKLTPTAYLRRLRLSRSALRLRDEKVRVLDVALDMGFGSVDGFQRAFFREFGCHPKEYAKRPVPLPLFTPYGVKYAHLEKEESRMEKARNVWILPVEKPERKVILKRGKAAKEYWSYCQEVGCDVWGILTSIPSLGGEPVCLWLPEAYRDPVENEYVQGVEVAADYDGPVPEGFDGIRLPAATYLEFRGEPFEEEQFEDAIRELWEAEERFCPEDIGYRWDATQPRIQLEPIGSRGYREFKAVTRI